ncbi:uncharacterized protein MONBRDRAFT_29884 [Monosiga brevicollis MX1]|uniref:Mitochondrial potassium channel ATP-binding subunit n=1 Tax=Monosiga brevicollis TaxID=81824 RepID=A9VCE9_MONBE|nr:uncharacterized protein MONBRDRAFT_29884 [Monosiga brevicollis MX1]EDQ84738.1 predicted protein [Monosiga brevicollis MX1]|eukprot:XP_001750388.1 hypothetical protein [Monosiga brevicollis MX1]
MAYMTYAILITGFIYPDRGFNWALFWELLRPDTFLLAAAVLAAIAVAFLNVQIPSALGQLVNIVTTTRAPGEMRASALQLAVLYLAQATFTCVYISLLGMVGERFAERVRNRLFESLLRQDLAFFDTRQSGEIVSRLSGDVQEFKSSFKQVVSIGLRNGLQAVGSLISMYLVSPQLTSYLAVAVPLVIAVGTSLGSLLRSMSKDGQAIVADANGSASEVIGNIRTVRAFGMEDREVNEYSSLAAKCRTLYIKLAFGIGVFTAGSNLFVNSLVLSVIYFGGKLMDQGTLGAGNLMEFLVCTQTIQRALSQTSVLFGQLVRGTSSGSRVFEYLDREPIIPTKGGMTLSSVDGDIEFVRVTFSYPSRPEQAVLRHFDLRLKAGKKTALCGPSGAGKSTIANLVERFYDPTEGAVMLDGHDIRTLDPQWLRSKVIGYVNQEPVLFATSVLENIRYGRPDATPEEVYEAARKANAHQFICGFPEGYDTVVGERGVTLSGGQSQRIAIARAILTRPRILILDESSSAMDAESEHLVQEALDRLTKDKTVLVIAHRLSTIRNADEIAVLHGGEVVELGTHRELLRKQGVYANLVKHQLSGEGGYVV